MSGSSSNAIASHVPTDCQDVLSSNPSAGDGEYLIAPGGRLFTAYCHDMAGTPKEYLTLQNTGGNFNYGQYTAGGASSGSNVRTSFTKVRIDPNTLLVNIGDQTFSTSTGFLTHSGSGPQVTSMSYGIAAGCLFGVPNGLANIDLTGLPFSVSDPFDRRGFPSPVGAVTFSSGSQIVNITAGGFCGWASPAPSMYNPFNSVGGFRLDLRFTGTVQVSEHETVLEIEKKVDALESKLDTSLDASVSSRASQASVDAIEAKADLLSSQASVDAIEVKADTLASQTSVDAIEAKADLLSSQASVDAIEAKLDNNSSNIQAALSALIKCDVQVTEIKGKQRYLVTTTEVGQLVDCDVVDVQVSAGKSKNNPITFSPVSFTATSLGAGSGKFDVELDLDDGGSDDDSKDSKDVKIIQISVKHSAGGHNHHGLIVFQTNGKGDHND
jgi:hypothetical protein